MRALTGWIVVLSAVAGAAPNPRQVVDLNVSPSKRSGSPGGFVTSASGGRAWFAASDRFGRELWVTDGTAVGTKRLTDLVPGTGDALPQPIGAVGETLIFSAVRPDVGRELFAIDGNDPASLRLLRDIVPGGSSGMTFSGHRVTSGVLNGVLYFAGGPETDSELWRSDGTPGGTYQVRDISDGGSSAPDNFIVVGGRLVFSATTSTSGDELWTSTGTFASTVMVADLNAGAASSSPANFMLNALGTVAFFSAVEASTGTELWKTDGTAGGTARLTDINPGTASSNPTPFYAVFTWLYFRALGPAGYELYRYDTNTSSLSLMDLEPGPRDSYPTGCAQIGSGGDALCLCRGSSSGLEIFSVFSTITSAAGDLIPGPVNSWYARILGADSLAMLVDVPDLPGSPLVSVASNGRLFPTGLSQTSDDTAAFAGQFLLGASDGTGEALYLVSANGYAPKRLHDFAVGTDSSAPKPGVSQGDRLFFTATLDPAVGPSLFETRGTPESTRQLSAPLGEAWSSLFAMTVLGGHLLVTGHWVSSYDLSTDGPWVQVAGAYSPVTPLGAKGYFVGAPPNDTELWATDGTIGGTTMVANLNPAGRGADARAPAALDGGLVFVGVGTSYDFEPYFTDGTTGSAVKLEINPSGSSNPTQLTQVGGRVFMVATTPATGFELFVTDGTVGGTHLVVDLTPGTGSTAVSAMRAANGKLYFSAGTDLWVSDGTPAGTVKLATGVNAQNTLTEVGGGRAFFAGDSPTQGRELWVTDGTPAGTTLAVDVRAGVLGSGPSELMSIGTEVLFSANGGDGAGVELWRSDGTPAGTRRVSDLAAGLPDSSPRNLLKAGPRVYFGATDLTGDEELYVYELDQSPPVITPTVTGTMGANGFYTSAVHVAFQVTDLETLAITSAPCAGVDVSEDTLGQIVTCTAESVGGSSTLSVTVKKDGAAPVLLCPADPVVEATSPAGAMVTMPLPTVADALDPSPTVSFAPAAGTFALGATSVVATAKDAAGNSSSCRFTVEVHDTTQPAVHCPADVSATTSDALGGPATFEVSATDAVDPAPVVLSDHASGSLFPAGDTVVHVTAFDRAGNSASCSFKVTEVVHRGCGCGAAEGLSGLSALLLAMRRRRFK